MIKVKGIKTTTIEKALEMGPRKFVRDYLFPAMRRERGNGFAMDTWLRLTAIRSPNGLDDICEREAPACGSVMCIGGTMQAILNEYPLKVASLAEVLGIGPELLFYSWRCDCGPWKGLSVPFDKARTPLEKERIAEKAVMAAIRIGERERKTEGR